jgi:hypothetical protein
LTKEISDERLHAQGILDSLTNEKRQQYEQEQKRLAKTENDHDGLDSPKQI